MGITAMQWVEGALWLDGPAEGSFWNRFLTIGLIPVALLAQPWGPLLGSLFVLPMQRRRWSFRLLLLLGLGIVVAARVIYQPMYTQVTPQGHLNWWSPTNPPEFSPWAYGLWALVIGAPFLLWWRPVWQSLLIVSWGWGWATLSYLTTDSAASHWCFFVSFYAAFVLVYALCVKDDPPPIRSRE